LGPGEEARSWSRRYRLNVERLASGDLDQVTQIVIDLERQEWEARLTAGEARQLARARQLRRILGGGGSA
jgi:CarD family transcriptional regulator